MGGPAGWAAAAVLSGAALPAFASINKSRIVPGAATAVRPALLAVPSGPAVSLASGLEPGAAQIRPARARGLLVKLTR